MTIHSSLTMQHHATWITGLALCTAVANPGAAAAAGAPEIIGGLNALFIEGAVSSQQIFCGTRFPNSATAWAEGSTRWKQANEATLTELRDIARRLGDAPPAELAVPDGAHPASRMMVTQGFRQMSTLQSAATLAGLNDAQATLVCDQRLAGLAPGGRVETALPAYLAAARKLHPR